MIEQKTALLRALLIARVREFLAGNGYLEVDTPALAPALIPEPHLEVFSTTYRHPLGTESVTANTGWRSGEERYLVPSPELWMKELLAAGYGNIFQISHCYRNAENVGPFHSPEFTMLEWYTVGAGYLDSITTTESLLRDLARGLADRGFDQDRLRQCAGKILRMTMDEAFERFAGISGGSVADGDHMVRIAKDAGIEVGTSSNADAEFALDDLFQRVFLTLVEDRLPPDRPVIITNYPSYIPTLAKTDPGSRTCERWELYFAGLELANCYTEERNRARLATYVAQATERKRHALVPHTASGGIVEFAKAPPCSGVALGIDRLMMALTGCRDIRDVIFSTAFGIFRGPQEGRGLA